MMQTAYALAVVFELALTEQHQALGNRLAEPGPGVRVSDRQPDKTINPGQMTSFNHYAFGAVADWLHRVLAGLAPAEPRTAACASSRTRSRASTSRTPRTRPRTGRPPCAGIAPVTTSLSGPPSLRASPSTCCCPTAHATRSALASTPGRPWRGVAPTCGSPATVVDVASGAGHRRPRGVPGADRSVLRDEPGGQ